MPKVNDWIRLKDASLHYYKQTGDKLPGVDCVRHWIKVGKTGYDGTNVKLKGAKRGGLWMTRRVWMDAFIEAMRRPDETCEVASQ